MVTKNLYSILFIFHLSISIGQISFQNISFNEALEKAKKEKKLVFLDCMTSWCGPCKYADMHLFSDSIIGDYFNENFISLKIDMEKGEGPTLKSKYHVSCYPTLMILDTNGNLLDYLTTIGVNKNDFLINVKKNNHTNYLYLKNKIDSKNYTSNDIYQFIKILNYGCQNYSVYLSEYEHFIQNDISQYMDAFDLFQNFDINKQSLLFEYIIKNIDHPFVKIPKDQIYSRIHTFYSIEINRILEIYDQTEQNLSYYTLMQEIHHLPESIREKLLNDLYINYLTRKEMWNELEIYFPILADKLSEDELLYFCMSVINKNKKLILYAFPYIKSLALKFKNDSFTQLISLKFECHFNSLDKINFDNRCIELIEIAKKDQNGFGLEEFIDEELKNLANKFVID